MDATKELVSSIELGVQIFILILNCLFAATDDLLQNSIRVTNIAPDIHSGHVGSFNRSSQKQSIILNGYPNGMGDELAAKGMFFVK